MLSKKLRTKRKNTVLTRTLCTEKASQIFIMSLIVIFLTLMVFQDSNTIFLQTSWRQGNSELLRQTELKVFEKVIDFSDISVITKLRNTKFDKCKFCSGIHRDNESASSKEDLAIAALYGNAKYNVLTWVRTLRSTGCKCSILFLVEKDYLSIYNKNEINAFNECGVTFWQTIDISNSKLNDKRVSKELV